MNKYDPITELRALLTSKQFDNFCASCFDHFIELPNFTLHNQLIHNLLLSQPKQPNPHEFWISVSVMKRDLA